MKSYWSRAFAVASPDLWNRLPDNIRSCDNLSNFKSLPNIFLNHLLSMAISISVLIHLLFDYLCKAPRAGLDTVDRRYTFIQGGGGESPLHLLLLLLFLLLLLLLLFYYSVAALT